MDKAFFKKHPKARIFETHGVDFTGLRGNQLHGYCPFSDEADKFYVNIENWLWDSKSAGMSGNIAQFLEHVNEDYVSAAGTDGALDTLAKHRGIPSRILRAYGVGINGSRYTLAVRDHQGRIVDIRLYDLKQKMMLSTAGCNVGLLNAHLLQKRQSEPVYMCEGEWDAMAIDWLLQLNKAPGIVLAVPGAGVLKTEWVPWLAGRKIHTLYDHDEAGENGEQLAFKRLSTATKLTTCTHWPEELPTGFDARDWVRYGVIKKKTPDLCLKRLQLLFKKDPRASKPSTHLAGKDGPTLMIKLRRTKERKSLDRPTLDDVHAVYRTWLKLKDTDAIDITLATALSQRFDGPPVWMFLVGPPGTGKTATMTGLNDYDKTYSTSSLTPHALISGANWQNGGDPSLIPRLNGRVLVIKDFTSILGMRDTDQEEIFGILRDAYDGKCGKVFGNGVERSFASQFTIIAAVTPRIYMLGDNHAALGERFLKYRMADNLHHDSEDDIIARAIENVDRDIAHKENIARVTTNFLQNSREDTRVDRIRIDAEMHRRIIAAAKFGSRLRGTVNRNVHQADMVMGRPFAEIGSRLGIQLAKLARSLALVRDKEIAGADEYRLIKRVVLDTISQRNEDMVRAFWFSPGHQVTVQELAERTRYPVTTVRRLLEDMATLDIVVKSSGSSMKTARQYWTLSPCIAETLETSGLYDTPRTPHPPATRRPSLRVRLVRRPAA